MTTLVWDETGSRYYETGVSKGIFFPIDGSTGVPWNGLVSVNLDPQGGDLESYWFDGIKYMDRILAEDFQATIQAITTPKEFRACEGDREYAPGVMTSFNKRDKFHMAWRTEIGSDVGEQIAYKLHIAYNCLVQPSARDYQTIADTSSIGTRNFVITATPACGRHSYFWFDSRDYDLSPIEELLYAGTLPKCHELATLIGTPDPDSGCPHLLSDMEKYIHGQVVADDDDNDATRVKVDGLVNNGLDITDLPAGGAFAANDSAASEVGTSPVVTDDDDATYITSADGDLGYTVGLPPLVGYVPGCAFELHIRMSISGGVNPDDPDNLDADAQVHISTDAGGDDTVGGFSDGTDEGMGFALTAVDGTIVDYIIPLRMDAWVDSTLGDVVTALEAGAYLNFVASANNNPDPDELPVVVNVYEMYVRMLNDTEPNKVLRVTDPTDLYSEIIHKVYESPGTVMQASVTNAVDFKVLSVAHSEDVEGYIQPVLQYPGYGTALTGTDPGAFMVYPYEGDGPKKVWLKWLDDAEDDTDTIEILDTGVWYRLVVDWGWEDARAVLTVRETGHVVFDVTHELIPFADHDVNIIYHGGSVGGPVNSYEVLVDNAELTVHCNDPAPVEPPPEWVDMDLSTALFFKGAPTFVTDTGLYDSGDHLLKNNPSWGSTCSFYFSGFTLDPTKNYQFELTMASGYTGWYFGIMQQNPANGNHFSSDNYELYFQFPELSVITANIGPGIDEWNAAITNGYQSVIRFDAATGVESLRYREV